MTQIYTEIFHLNYANSKDKKLPIQFIRPFELRFVCMSFIRKCFHLLLLNCQIIVQIMESIHLDDSFVSLGTSVAVDSLHSHDDKDHELLRRNAIRKKSWSMAPMIRNWLQMEDMLPNLSPPLANENEDYNNINNYNKLMCLDQIALENGARKTVDSDHKLNLTATNTTNINECSLLKSWPQTSGEENCHPPLTMWQDNAHFVDNTTTTTTITTTDDRSRSDNNFPSILKEKSSNVNIYTSLMDCCSSHDNEHEKDVNDGNVVLSPTNPFREFFFNSDTNSKGEETTETAIRNNTHIDFSMNSRALMPASSTMEKKVSWYWPPALRNSMSKVTKVVVEDPCTGQPTRLLVFDCYAGVDFMGGEQTPLRRPPLDDDNVRCE